MLGALFAAALATAAPTLPSIALGHVVPVAGTTLATVYAASIRGPKLVCRSTDGGLCFPIC